METKVSKGSNDYRTSHVGEGKGLKYHNSFQTSPYRKYIWSKESSILLNVVKDKFSNKVNSYLDFACGTGRIICLLESFVDYPIGVDVSESMLSVAKKQVKKAKLFRGDITKEEILGEHNFKLITAFRFFLRAEYSLKNDVMKKLSSLLDDSGYLVFNIHNNTSSISNNLSKVYTKIKYGESTYRDEMSVDEVYNLVEQNGLEVIEIIPYGTFPIFNESNKFPTLFVKWFDTLFSNKKFSTYLIYICKKKQSS